MEFCKMCTAHSKPRLGLLFCLVLIRFVQLFTPEERVVKRESSVLVLLELILVSASAIVFLAVIGL